MTRSSTKKKQLHSISSQQIVSVGKRQSYQDVRSYIHMYSTRFLLIFHRCVWGGFAEEKTQGKRKTKEKHHKKRLILSRSYSGWLS